MNQWQLKLAAKCRAVEKPKSQPTKVYRVVKTADGRRNLVGFHLTLSEAEYFVKGAFKKIDEEKVVEFKIELE